MTRIADICEVNVRSTSRRRQSSNLVFLAFLLLTLALTGFAYCGEIQDAVENGDAETVKALLEANPNLVNTKTEDGDTLLQLAALSGHEDVVRLLLRNGADVNAKDGISRTALHEVAFVWWRPRDDTNIADLLLDNGADANARDKYGDTPLDFACENGKSGVVAALLAHHANVNTKNAEGRSPLFLALNAGHQVQDVATFLLNNGADVNATDGMG
jgi:ankyrin repeat protein